MCFRLLTLAVVAGAILPTQETAAQLGPFSYSTLEEQVLNSESVLLVKITEITGTRRQLGDDTFKIAFTTESAFKGHGETIWRDRLDQSDDYFYLFATREQIEAWIKVKARLVIRSPSNVSTNSESARVLVDLSQKKLQQLSLGDDGVLRALSSEKGILAAIKHIAQKSPGVTRVRTYQMITEAKLVKEANLIVQDGYPIAFVPIDRPLERWAKRKISSGDGVAIESAVRALSHFPSDANADWVRAEIANRKTSDKLKTLSRLLDKWESSN